MKRGVILMNLGSPDSTEVKDVRRYLAEFLMDKRVIDYPYFFRLLLVRGIIAPTRAPKSAEAYRTVWTKDGSPLIALTNDLQKHVQALTEDAIEISMRYGHPKPETAYDNLMRRLPDLKEVVLMPLYPHYAMSSYETAVEYMKQAYKSGNYPFKLKVVAPFYNDPQYIQALCDRIKPFLNKDFDKLLFSYHGLPERHILKGDITRHHCLQSPDCCSTASPAHQFCYRHQCFETMRLVTETLQIPRNKFDMSFQSRLGRDKWLSPSTAELLEKLPGQGVKKLMIVCPAFVSDCLETLEEIAITGKKSFLAAGGEEFTMIPCLNSQSLWVKTILSLVENCD